MTREDIDKDEQEGVGELSRKQRDLELGCGVGCHMPVKLTVVTKSDSAARFLRIQAENAYIHLRL